MFTARELDEETGLCYYRARMYDARLGRFLQTDPIGYYDSMNLYQYVTNNPINYIDPSGLCECDEYIVWTLFWACTASGMTGIELAGPALTVTYLKSKAARKHYAKVAIRLLGKVGKKIGGKLIPYIGWGLTIIDLANTTAKCKQEATRCR